MVPDSITRRPEFEDEDDDEYEHDFEAPFG
jgi:hypothetical protein